MNTNVVVVSVVVVAVVALVDVELVDVLIPTNKVKQILNIFFY